MKRPRWQVVSVNLRSPGRPRCLAAILVAGLAALSESADASLNSIAKRAGVANATFIFVLPGSPGACRDAWDGILKPQLDYRQKPCNFVEIMPRLEEHRRKG
jgi:hypothetical protein